MEVDVEAKVKEGKEGCYTNLCGIQAVSSYLVLKESVGKNFTL